MLKIYICLFLKCVPNILWLSGKTKQCRSRSMVWCATGLFVITCPTCVCMFTRVRTHALCVNGKTYVLYIYMFSTVLMKCVCLHLLTIFILCVRKQAIGAFFSAYGGVSVCVRLCIPKRRLDDLKTEGFCSHFTLYMYPRRARKTHKEVRFTIYINY